MKQAVADHRLRAENEKLLADLQSANYLLRAVMDQLDTGAIAVDAKGIVQAVNRPAREFFGRLENTLRPRGLLQERDVRKDDVVEIERAGDVIPAVVKVFTEQRGKDSVLRIASRVKPMKSIPARARAVLIASPAPGKVPLRLGSMPNSD